jgi:serine---pyruvate transaminase
MEKEKLLMTPGPTMIPSSVLEIMSRQIIHHRTAEFEAAYIGLEEDLKLLFQTQNMVLMFASSGTGAMESAVVNLFCPGDKVLVVSIGSFGNRFAEICETYGLDVVKLAYEWGMAADVNDIKDILDKDTGKEIRGVFITHNETSTGVTNNIEAVGKLIKDTDRLLIVDAISSMGGLELKTDEWGIDVVVTGSQKGLMCPPGLAYASVSDKAWSACERSTLPKFYFDYKKFRKGFLGQGENPPYTPAVSLILGQAEALRIIKEEGFQNVYDRHRKLALATQAGVAAMGLELFASQEVSSYIITAVKAPEGVEIGKVIKTMNNKYDIIVAGGQKHLKGKIFRIGHCGYVDRFDLLRGFSALESALNENGYKVEPGVAVAAVQKALAE